MKAFATAFSFAWISIVASSALATTALEQTREVLEETRKIVSRDDTRDAKLTELSRQLDAFLDTDEIGRRALGAHWRNFSAAEQREFLALFRVLFQRTYVQKLLFFDRPDFEYVGEEAEGSEFRVETRILTPRDEFAVFYRMRPAGDRWLATDIQVEDLSLTRNFERQLDRLLANAPPADVIGRMRRKYGPGGNGGDEP